MKCSLAGESQLCYAADMEFVFALRACENSKHKSIKKDGRHVAYWSWTEKTYRSIEAASLNSMSFINHRDHSTTLSMLKCLLWNSGLPPL
jgi:hypothetical protein